MLLRAFAIVATLTFAAALPADAQTLDKVERVCASIKLKVTAKKTLAKLKCEAAAIMQQLADPAPECLAKAEQKFLAAFTKAEANGGCVSEADAAAVETAVDTFVQQEVHRQTTAGGPLPSCPTYGSPCGSCGDGMCAYHEVYGGDLVCVSSSGAVMTMCTSDTQCTSPPICVNVQAASGCVNPCP